MANTVGLKEILQQVQKLDRGEQLTLLEKLVGIIKKKEKTSSPVKLSSIAGIGAELWKDIDIDKYVENERQW